LDCKALTIKYSLNHGFFKLNWKLFLFPVKKTAQLLKYLPMNLHTDNYIRSVCVFCSSSNLAGSIFMDSARELGRGLGRMGLTLIYGGASIGMMGQVASGVHEEGGRVIGVLPEFFRKKEIEYLDADELIVTPDMRSRRAIMEENADAFIALPGGIGTLEEITEILSMRQLKLMSKPLILVNIDGFFDILLALLTDMVQRKFVKPEFLTTLVIVADAQTALDYLASHYTISPQRTA
jgi:cytokinin riboside 5'-monophosphate phosphoribohydrolase